MAVFWKGANEKDGYRRPRLVQSEREERHEEDPIDGPKLRRQDLKEKTSRLIDRLTTTRSACD